LATAVLGQRLEVVEMPLQARDSLAVTVACAQCQSIEVYMLSTPRETPATLVCLNCHALLRLEFDRIEAR
jgi:hypothetical protein